MCPPIQWHQFGRVDKVAPWFDIGDEAEDLARAVLKCIAIFVALSMERGEALWRESGRVIDKLVVDGGLARSDLLMQMQADVLDKAVHRPKS